MPSHSALKWPRSDGSSSNWPPTGGPSKGGGTWFEPSGDDDSRIKSYKDGVGAYLAKHLGLPPPYEKYSIDLPPGYRLYTHFQPRDGAEIRTDRYLFGSDKVKKASSIVRVVAMADEQFRSVPEFVEHAVWLFDETRPLDDHSQCNCRYAGNKPIPKTTPSGSSKRPSGTSASGSRKKQRADSSSSDDSSGDVPTAIVPERLEDFLGQRIFRKGEMIFFKIDPVVPPAGRARAPITHWVGLVSGIDRRKGSKAEDGPAEKFEYQIRPLGLFASDEPVIRSSKDMLPFALGEELFEGQESWNKFGEEGTDVMRRGVQQEAADELKHGYVGGKIANMEERWRAKWGLRIKFSEMGKNWDAWVLRFAIAVKIAIKIRDCWTQTDRIDVIAEDMLPEEERKMVKEQRKTLWQGVWWAGERMWVGDMVRLRRSRNELPEGLGAPGKGAAERAVFFRINQISIEVSPSNPDPEVITLWRCLLYGDVFELVDETEASEESRPAQTLTMPLQDAAALSGDSKKATAATNGSGGMLVPVEKKYRAPKGLAYKQLNVGTAEVTADIMDVAGRAYPHLLDLDSQNWFADSSRTAEENKGRKEPGDTAKALSGILSGAMAFQQSETWMEDLFGMVAQANHTIEKDMRDYYTRLLQEQLKVSLPQKPRNSEGGDAGGAGGASKPGQTLGKEAGNSVAVGA